MTVLSVLYISPGSFSKNCAHANDPSQSMLNSAITSGVDNVAGEISYLQMNLVFAHGMFGRFFRYHTSVVYSICLFPAMYVCLQLSESACFHVCSLPSLLITLQFV